MFLITYKLNSLLNMLKVFLLSSIWEDDELGIMDFSSLAITEKRICRKNKPRSFLS